MSEHTAPSVVDDRDASRFVLELEGSEAELTYRVRGGTLYLVHTGVPTELGGRGLGGTLVQAAVTRAAEDGLTVAPWCPFARRWLEGHPDVAGTVTIDWAEPPRP